MFSSRLKELRKENNYTQVTLAKAIGVSQQTVGKWEARGSEPDFDTLNKIAKIFNVSVDYLTGNTFKANEDDIVERRNDERLPILGMIKAGFNMYAEQNILGYKEADSLKVKGKDCFWLKVSGNSMNQVGIIHNSLILVEKKSDVSNKKIAVVRINGDEATVKQVIYVGDKIMLQARSTDSYDPIFLSQDDFENGHAEIIGEVIEVSFNPNELF